MFEFKSCSRWWHCKKIYLMTLMFSSIWLNFRPFPFIWLNFSSHRALQYSVISHIQRNPTNHCKQCGHIAPTHDRQLVASFGRRLHGAAGYTLRRLRSPLWLHSLPVTLAAGYALRPCDTLRRLHCPPVTLSALVTLSADYTVCRLHSLSRLLSPPSPEDQSLSGCLKLYIFHSKVSSLNFYHP